MLDLIIFALAILATKFISQKHPLLAKDNNSNNNDQPTNQSKQQYQTNNIARYIFQICLLISLLLFSLSILEVAPIAYLLIIDSSTLFIVWYRALLWSQCLILLVLHPIFLGVILVSSLCTTTPANNTNTSSPRSSISRATSVSDINNNTTNRQKKRSSFIIGLNILWISIRFFMVSIVWRIIRKIMGVIIPY